MKADAIINFWFESIEPKSWWIKDQAFDQLLRDKFTGVHQKASRGELYKWRETSLGRLAEIIILDQFSRNMYRNSAKAFVTDTMALILAQEAINAGANNQLERMQLAFLCMPFIHSESILIHQQALKLFSEPGLEDSLNSEKQHLAIIERFGRYPHRNEILGRESTIEEIEFLKKPGSTF